VIVQQQEKSNLVQQNRRLRLVFNKASCEIALNQLSDTVWTIRDSRFPALGDTPITRKLYQDLDKPDFKITKSELKDLIEALPDETAASFKETTPSQIRYEFYLWTKRPALVGCSDVRILRRS